MRFTCLFVLFCFVCCLSKLDPPSVQPPPTPAGALPTSPSASAAYGNVRACEACFTLHQTEAALVRAERRLAAAVGGAQATGRWNFGRTGLDSGTGRAAWGRAAEAESRGVEVEGRGSLGGGGRSSACGGEARKGLKGSRSAGSLGAAGKRQGRPFYGKREVSERFRTALSPPEYRCASLCIGHRFRRRVPNRAPESAASLHGCCCRFLLLPGVLRRRPRPLRSRRSPESLPHPRSRNRDPRRPKSVPKGSRGAIPLSAAPVRAAGAAGSDPLGEPRGRRHVGIPGRRRCFRGGSGTKMRRRMG